jgi:hydrogenase small subunit
MSGASARLLLRSHRVSELDARLSLEGVTRRDFLAFCGAMGLALGLGETAVPSIADALERGARLTPAIWLNLGSCTGCTESLAQSGAPGIASIVLDMLSLDYMEALAAAAGAQAEAALEDTLRRGGHLAIVEGAVMTGEGGNALRIAGTTGDALLQRVCGNAALVVAVGSCAVDGGWVRARPNPAGATGVLQHLPQLAPKLVNLPTCPVNPEWVVAILTSHLLGLSLPALDELRRPLAFFGRTIHDACPRRGHFEAGEFVERFGSEEEGLGWCLYDLGCKGPVTRTDCPRVRWNRGVSWCVEAGSPCIGCGSLDWVDAGAPFFSRTKAVRPGVAGLRPEVIGEVVAAGTAGAFAAWGVVETARGRLHEQGPPSEPDARQTDDGASR